MKFRQLAFTVLTLAAILCRPALASEIDFSKAITIGTGPKLVIEFTDPDCPFCRKASAYFSARSDVSQQVFFYPLPRHPRAREKAQFVLSMPDKARAYNDVMAGKMDLVAVLPTTAEGVKLLEQQVETSRKFKVDATPTFIINGRIIEGFDIKRIEEALGARQ